MNVCIFVSTFPTYRTDPSGGFVLDFCLELSKFYNITVITQARSEAYNIDKRINLITFKWSGKEIHLANLKFSNPKHIWHILSLFINARKTIRRFIKSNHVDRTFALWALPSGLASLFLFRRYGIPFDVWCLGSDIWMHKNNKLTGRILHRILKRSDNLYADGFEFCKEIERFSEKKCLFLASCRELDKPKIEKVETNIIRFVFIGRYHYNKGPDVLLNAIKILPEKILDETEFVFYGAGALKNILLSTASQNKMNNVYIHDTIDKHEIFGLLSNSHFIIIPSRYDSIPVILSDALQCETPVIGADIGDLGPIIKEFGLGYTFQKENVLELSKCIFEAFNDKKENYLNNIQNAMKIFSVQNSVNTYISNIN